LIADDRTRTPLMRAYDEEPLIVKYLLKGEGGNEG